MSDNLQEQLYQRIRESLLAGYFKPGQALKIRDLAAQWGTSPMPVRAALQRLVAEGALEGEQQRSMRVPSITPERYENILQVRLALEGLAVELATPRLTADDLSELKNCVQLMDTAIEQRQVQGYLNANSQFHLLLYGACGNPILLRSIESLWLQIGPLFNRIFTGADLSLRLNDFHEDAFAALEAGDAKGARLAMEQDLTYFGRFLINLLELEQRL